MKSQFTDAELTECIEAGMRPAAIARRFGVNKSNVCRRMQKLNIATVAVLHSPEGQRTVNRYAEASINAAERIGLLADRARLLSDACDRWLRDPDNPEQYDVGARASDVTIIYEETITTESGRPRKVTRKERLSKLLEKLEETGALGEGFVAAHLTHADPRQLILNASKESRGLLDQATRVLNLLADARRVEDFQAALMEAIRDVDADTADRIAEAIRRALVRRGNRLGPDALSEGDAGGDLEPLSGSADAGV